MSATTGCKSQPHVNAHIESVNAEYRQLEDYVYTLEEQNAKLQQELDAARQLAATGQLPGAPTPPPRGGLFRRGPAGRTPSTPPADAAPDMQPPVIELPGETNPSPSAPRSMFRQPSGPGIELTPPSDTPPSIDLPRPSTETIPTPAGEPKSTPATEILLPVPQPGRLAPKPTDTKVTHLFVNPSTGGCDLDGQPGDDGLKIVLEPRNAANEYVPEVGSLSLVVLDPELIGDAARVARWDFDQDAARQVLTDSGSSQGLKLEMPWPASTPTANRLRLFVRYETPDGRRIQTDRDIYVSPPGQNLSRWTPRATEETRTARVQPATKLDADR